jgi:hypothetical protein
MSAEVAAVLDEAADVIVRNGWRQGGYFAPVAGLAHGECPVCLVGAIGVVVAGEPQQWRYAVEGRAAVVAVHRYLGFEEDRDPENLDYTLDRVSLWNDDETTNDTLVVAVLRAAAATERAGA